MAKFVSVTTFLTALFSYTVRTLTADANVASPVKSAQELFDAFDHYSQYNCNSLVVLSQQIQDTVYEMIRSQQPGLHTAFQGLNTVLSVSDLDNPTALLDGILRIQTAFDTVGVIYRSGNMVIWSVGTKDEDGSVSAKQFDHDETAPLWWKPLLTTFSQVGYNDTVSKVYLQRLCEQSPTQTSRRSSFPKQQEQQPQLSFLLTKHFRNYKFQSGVVYVHVSPYKLSVDQCDDSTQEAFRASHLCDRNYTKCSSVKEPAHFFARSFSCCCLANQSSCFIRSGSATFRNEAEFCSAQGGGDGVVVGKFLMSVNFIVIFLCLVLIFVVMAQRKVQSLGTRGWALMELCICGASLLYSIVVLEFFSPDAVSCILIVWFRQLGFSLFYGSIVLKIYRNLIEFRVRQAHHVFVKEKDLLKYLSAIELFTLTGLIAWTLSSLNQYFSNGELDNNGDQRCTNVFLEPGTWSGGEYRVCRISWWSYCWHFYEVCFLTYGLYLCKKAKNTAWWEKKQFTTAISLEALVTLVANVCRYAMINKANPDHLLLLTFFQTHFTVTISLLMIIVPKFRNAGNAQNRSSSTIGGSKAHPSLAKLRDGLANGTIDFAQIPIADMDPEDIKAELKRVYTQLRMFKIKNIYEENPHIYKRKGAKKSSNASKQTNRRLSGFAMPSLGRAKDVRRQEEEALSAARVSEEDEPSVCSMLNADLTVHSSPHNLYIARQTPPSVAPSTARRLQLDNDKCFRI